MQDSRAQGALDPQLHGACLERGSILAVMGTRHRGPGRGCWLHPQLLSQAVDGFSI